MWRRSGLAGCRQEGLNFGRRQQARDMLLMSSSQAHHTALAVDEPQAWRMDTERRRWEADQGGFTCLWHLGWYCSGKKRFSKF